MPGSTIRPISDNLNTTAPFQSSFTHAIVHGHACDASQSFIRDTLSFHYSIADSPSGVLLDSTAEVSRGRRSVMHVHLAVWASMSYVSLKSVPS